MQTLYKQIRIIFLFNFFVREAYWCNYYCFLFNQLTIDFVIVVVTIKKVEIRVYLIVVEVFLGTF